MHGVSFLIGVPSQVLASLLLSLPPGNQNSQASLPSRAMWRRYFCLPGRDSYRPLSPATVHSDTPTSRGARDTIVRATSLQWFGDPAVSNVYSLVKQLA